MEVDLQQALETARAAAEAAAEIHRDRLGSVDVDQADDKGRMDFVTQVDLDAQRAALAIILRNHPDHQVLAEEDDPGEAGSAPRSALDPGRPTWVVDPLDGTRNFLTRHPMHCASVGLVVGGEPVVGAVVSAPLGVEWWAARGTGAYRNGRPFRSPSAPGLDRGLIGTGFPFKAIHRLDEYLRGFGAVIQRSAGIRRDGSAAIDLCHLAEGVLAGFWELVLAPWDVAGALAILHEAGGAARRLDGRPLEVLEPGSVLAAGYPPDMDRLEEWLAQG